ncbi:hypothetical protein [Limnoglobus roseus]|uniref:Uncharacterized protein n=1 Tax=Limnoglobus roseus TaxID=2598579 RepID=A0A5C1A7N3_9BACT|nr:hypothetical protein [Limnoglobus roseus]QEL13852.1 hypothetical protein PX52LOC_00710 [Limnoglobus roseus]
MTDQEWVLDQIGRFRLNFKTYVLDVAQALACDFQSEGRLHTSGFFILAGVTSYFEGVGQHLLGNERNNNEEFVTTFKDAFDFGGSTDEVAKMFKQYVRNGLPITNAA